MGLVLTVGWGYAMGKFDAFPAAYIERALDWALRGDEHSRADWETSLTEDVMKRLVQASDDPATGFTRHDAAFTDGGYLLLAGFSIEHGQSIFELVRLRDFKSVHTWVPPLAELAHRFRHEDASTPLGSAAFRPSAP